MEKEQKVDIFAGSPDAVNENVSVDDFLNEITGKSEKKVEEVQAEESIVEPKNNKERYAQDFSQHPKFKKTLEANKRLEQELEELRQQVNGLGNRQPIETEVDPELTMIFGDNEAGKQASKLMQQLMERKVAGAKEEVASLKSELNQSKVLEQKAEQDLEENVSYLEDKYDIDLSSEDAKPFFKLWEKLSPKDEDGNVREYADPDGVMEVYQARLSAPKQSNASIQKKALADRSMAKANESVASMAPNPKELKRFSWDTVR